MSYVLLFTFDIYCLTIRTVLTTIIFVLYRYVNTFVLRDKLGDRSRDDDRVVGRESHPHT